jgi:hypothetical protein
MALAIVGLVTVAIGVTVFAWLAGSRTVRARAAPTVSPTAQPSGATEAPRPPAPVFAIYYLWWDRQHWLTRLGTSYPVNAKPDPLPSTLDSSSCGAVNLYPGNQLTDVSQTLAYDESNPATIRADVTLAAASGVTGFLVNWIGTGKTNQTLTSSNYNSRLGAMFDAVHSVNAAGTPFRLVLNYQSSAKTLSFSQFSNDFDYFLARYGQDAALDHSYSTRPEVVMAGTWKYSDAMIQQISSAFRKQLYLLGDEKPSSWNSARASSLDGTSYYWSSQDPNKNPSSFAALRTFATTVRSTPNPDGTTKTWLAPFAPGYNAMLLYHKPTCVARNDGATMRALFTGNATTQPQGWTLISWNEISEGSYVVPLTRYGTKYTDELKSLIQGH